MCVRNYSRFNVIAKYVYVCILLHVNSCENIKLYLHFNVVSLVNVLYCICGRSTASLRSYVHQYVEYQVLEH